MTLAAAKVVVAEQMKIQGRSSNELSLRFQQEIEQIQKEFSDKTYWKLTQPKVYLHQLEHRTFGKTFSRSICFSSFAQSPVLFVIPMSAILKIIFSLPIKFNSAR